VHVFFFSPSIDICKHDEDPENASECMCDALRPSQDAVKCIEKQKEQECVKSTQLPSTHSEEKADRNMVSYKMFYARRKNQKMLETPDAVQNLNERDCSCFLSF
jgi:hypothetical protein